MHVLALSSSRVGNNNYLSSAVPMMRGFLGRKSLRLAFIPFAAVDSNYEEYAGKVRDALSSLPLIIETVTPENGKEVVQNCDAIVVGGGNTFKLLHDIYEHDVFSLIREKVNGGAPYIGWSAGSNLAGKTIGTTNDMPIIQPQHFAGFGFLPFQINPHYHNVTIEGFHGETRDQRIIEFLQMNPGMPVVGLPEGTALQLMNGKLQLLGGRSAVLFENSRDDVRVAKIELPSGTDLSYLMKGNS